MGRWSVWHLAPSCGGGMRSGKALGVGADAARKTRVFCWEHWGALMDQGKQLVLGAFVRKWGCRQGLSLWNAWTLPRMAKRRGSSTYCWREGSGLARRKAHQAQHMLMCSRLRLTSDGLSLKQDFGSQAEIEVWPWQWESRILASRPLGASELCRNEFPHRDGK